ncbi:hypothetical protein OIE63_16835 [Streptomyces sp. NBC_01795]|uniref:hypothetical protein n=1 Tax=unclassified Streptomyces TaxID=2593676 RepID=UPI002DDC531E|nr:MULTISPECIES: hypothetical protein [unclassified Streptomyces]WSA93051.1 hypothetical protein OIE63_16835 [Streptomyces sp. NBC_01795]WSS14313.1 hypothetical protein OG533_22295 [Streptomyces sp. NBC_01186]
MNATEDAEEREWVRARLRAAADAHQPDRARMAARIARAVEEPGSKRRTRRATMAPFRWGPRAPRTWPRVASAVGALVVVLGTGATTALWAQGGDGAADPPTVRTSAGPAGTGRAAGPLTSRGAVDPGSNDYWSQTEVTVASTTRLTALTVELRIAEKARKLASTGSWRTRPPQDYDVSVKHEEGALVYRWTLRKGRTVPPGKHVFAGQFDHSAGKRNAKGDSYTVSATAEGHERTVGGGIG